MAHRWSLFLLVALAGCRESGPTTPPEQLSLQPETVDLGAAFLGKERTAQLELRNAGRASLALTYEALAPPFELVDPPPFAGPGSTQLTVRFRPLAAGGVTARLTVIAETERREVTLVGMGMAHPACPTPVTCEEAFFNLQTERCEARPLVDGTPCDPSNVCVLNAVCRGGKCEGTPRLCDDGNACTVDLCNPLAPTAEQACSSVPAPPCPDDLATCRLGTCDPALGCTFTRARDGTICARDEEPCDGVGVCISGDCQQRLPPEGFVCAEPTPCRAEGRCRNKVCVQPLPVPLAQRQTPFFSTEFPDTGHEFDFHDFVLEPSGEISLLGWFARPILRYNPARPHVFAREQTRRCILWNGRLVCLDYGFPRYGVVAMIDAGTGAEQWRFDLIRTRPDFAAQALPGGLFLARIAVLGSDRFAVLFEGYPRGVTLPSNCRVYFLVILDPGGKMIHARKLDDPFLEGCDHPHPHGFSSDVQGNLYIAFANSQGPAPLQPASPTQFVSYTRNGALRWSRQLPVRGGEIAVAKGKLYAEQARQVLDAATGEISGEGVVWGRAVLSDDTVVQAPPPLGLGRGTALNAYDSRTLRPRWTHLLPAPQQFNSYELRLAEWKPRAEAPRDWVALAFATWGAAGESTELLALRLQDGKVAFRCELPELTGRGPDLFELDHGALAMVEGNQTCGRCDPPFADSRGTFRVYQAPGLFVPSVPWPGTFGGPAHHGQELPAFRPPVRVE